MSKFTSLLWNGLKIGFMYRQKCRFSIMEYYNKIRPPPQPYEPLNLIPEPAKKPKSQPIPYFGPNITRQPIPLEASSLSWDIPKSPEGSKFIKVALVGLPNAGLCMHCLCGRGAGKSSLLNALIRSNIAAVSPKVNTTREGIAGIVNVGTTQIVFLDCPGIVASHPRRRFCSRLVRVAKRHLNEAHACLLVVDTVKRAKSDLFGVVRSLCARAPFSDEHTSVPEAVYESDQEEDDEDDDNNSDDDEDDDVDEEQESNKRPVALVLNKIDLATHKKWVKARRRELLNHGHFADIFYTSAKYAIGLEPLLDYLQAIAKEGPWIYPNDMITGLTKVQVIEQLIRGCIYCWFNKDVPYRIGTTLIGWTRAENGCLVVEGELHVRNNKMAKLVCGIRGRIVRQIERNVSYKLGRMWNEPVMLRLHVKVKPNLIAHLN